MNDVHDDKVNRALSDEGTYDPERAEKMLAEIGREFTRKHCIVERYLWIVQWGVTAFIVYTAMEAFHSDDTRSLLLYGLPALAAFEGSILIKLWYWIVNNKLSVLESVKRMELVLTHGADPPELAPGVKGLIMSVGVPRWERNCWLGLVVVSASLIGGYEAFSYSTSFVQDRALLRVDVDGTVHARTVSTRTNRSSNPTWGFPFYAPHGSTAEYFDAQGRKLRTELFPYNETLSLFWIE